jgi:hypothetical protein
MIRRRKERTEIKIHKVPLKRCPGLCHCIECNEEIEIWKEYGATSNTLSDHFVLSKTNMMRRCSTNSIPLGKHKNTSM